MAGSPADAVSHAVERSKQLLFPVKIEKWFALGFTVFLAQCGDGGGTGNVPTNFPTGRSSSPPLSGSPSDLRHAFEEALRTFQSDVALYVSLAVGTVVIGLGLWLFVLWFSSRAKLMLVESVIWDRVDVGGQWTRAAELGASLFKFRAVLGASGWLLFLASAAAGIAAGLPAFLAGNFWGPRAWAAYATFALGALLVGIPLAIASALVDDFVVPLMVLRNARVAEAIRACRAEVLAGNVGGLVLFYLLKVVLALGIGMVAAVLTCLTCCLAAIPYLGTVLLLPLFVFSRAYPLYYLEQLGVPVFPPPEPSWAAYEQWRFPR
jgi:hypothetical protein